MAKMRQKY